MGEQGLPPDALAAARAHSAVAARRLGWLLENIGEVDGLDELTAHAATKGGVSLTDILVDAESRALRPAMEHCSEQGGRPGYMITGSIVTPWSVDLFSSTPIGWNWICSSSKSSARSPTMVRSAGSSCSAVVPPFTSFIWPSAPLQRGSRFRQNECWWHRGHHEAAYGDGPFVRIRGEDLNAEASQSVLALAVRFRRQVQYQTGDQYLRALSCFRSRQGSSPSGASGARVAPKPRCSR